MGVSLRVLLVVPFVCQVVGVTSLVGYLSYRSGQQAVEDLAHQLMEETGDRVGDNLASLFDLIESVAQNNAAVIQQELLDIDHLPSVQDYFVQQTQNFPALSIIGLTNESGDFISVEQQAIERLVIRKLDASVGREFYRYLADAQGKNLVLQEVRTDYDPHNDPPGNSVYQKIKDTGQASWSLIVSLARGKDQPEIHTAYSLPLYDADGQFQGVTGVTSSLIKTGAFLANSNVSPRGQVLVIERNGLLIATSTDEVPFDSQSRSVLAENVEVQWRRRSVTDSQNTLTQAVAEHLLNLATPLDQIKQAQGFQFSLDAEWYYAQVVPIQGELDWLMVTVVPRSDFMSEIHANMRHTILLCGLALLGAIGVGLGVVRWVVRPLQQLNRAAQAYAAGDPQPPIAVSQIHEVEALRRAFEQMMTDLDAQKRQVAELHASYTHALEQKVAERTEALSTVTAKLEEAQRIAQVGSWELDTVTGQITCSNQLYPILGLDAEAGALSYPDILAVVLPADQEQIRQAIDRAIAHGTPYAVEHRITHPDGSIRHVVSRGEPILDDQGQVIQLAGTAADITDHKRMEIALKQSEIRFWEISDTSPANIYVLVQRPDGSRYFEHISRAIEVIQEIPMADILADANVLFACIHPEDQAGYDAAVQQSFETLSPFEYTWRIVTPSGQTKWLRGSSRPKRRDNGEIAWYGVVLDITEQKAAEARLRAEADFRRAIERAIVEGIAVVDPEGRQIYVNPAFCQMLGWSQAELLGATPPFVYWPPEEMERITQSLQQALAGKRPSQGLELRFMRRTGERFDVLILDAPLQNEAGEVTAWLASVYDISDRKRTERALQQLNQELTEWRDRYDIAVQAGRQIIFEYDFTRDRYTWGHNAQDILGYSLAELPHCLQDSLLLIHPDDLPHFQTLQTDKLQTDRFNRQAPFQLEFRLRKADGTYLWIEDQGIVQRDEQGNPVKIIGSIKDISDRKQAELELQLLNAQLHELATTDSLTKIANRRQFLATLEHLWQHHQREQLPLTLMLLDIDHFKAYNDFYGHPVGDTCLTRVAQIIGTCLHRASDLVARYGGEEFIISLPNTHQRGAEAIAQRIQQAIAAEAIPHETSPTAPYVTVSIGITVVNMPNDFASEAAIAKADAALYRAKKIRNCYHILLIS